LQLNSHAHLIVFAAVMLSPIKVTFFLGLWPGVSGLLGMSETSAVGLLGSTGCDKDKLVPGKDKLVPGKITILPGSLNQQVYVIAGSTLMYRDKRELTWRLQHLCANHACLVYLTGAVEEGSDILEAAEKEDPVKYAKWDQEMKEALKLPEVRGIFYNSPTQEKWLSSNNLMYSKNNKKLGGVDLPFKFQMLHVLASGDASVTYLKGKSKEASEKPRHPEQVRLLGEKGDDCIEPFVTLYANSNAASNDKLFVGFFEKREVAPTDCGPRQIVRIANIANTVTVECVSYEGKTNYKADD